MLTEPIKTDEEYKEALKRLDEIIGAPKKTKEAKEALELSDLIEDYEDGLLED